MELRCRLTMHGQTLSRAGAAMRWYSRLILWWSQHKVIAARGVNESSRR